jgi:hypothetical protein
MDEEIVLCCKKCQREWLTTDRNEECPFCADLHPMRFACSGVSPSAYGTMVQDIKINVDLGREEIFELGRHGPYRRFVDFPVEITEDLNASPPRNTDPSTE